MTEMQPEESHERAITLRLTRHTIVLIAALLFLGLTMLLAYLFPPSSTVIVNGTATVPSPGAAVTTSPGQSTPTSPDAVPPGGYPNPDPNGGIADGGYPGPEGTAVGVLPTPAPGTPQPTGEIGVDEPSTNQPSPFVPTVTTPAPGYPGPDNATPLPSLITPLPTEDPLFEPDDPTATPGSPPTAPTPAPVVRPPTAAPPQPAPTTVPPDKDTPTEETEEPTPTRTRPTAQPTEGPAGGVDGEPIDGSPSVPVPAAPPVNIIQGNVRWTPANGPIIVSNDTQIPTGSTLTIDPGTEVRIAPGTALIVEGSLLSRGEAGKPVTITGLEKGRWDAIYGRGGTIVLEQTRISGGGNGGTLLAAEGGALTMRDATIRDNGGQIRTTDTRLDVRNSDISGNDLPYGSALESVFTRGGGATVSGNRIGGNRLAAGAAALQVSNTSPFDTLNLDVSGNFLTTDAGPNLALRADGPLQGSVACNALMNGTNGLSLLSSAPQVPGFNLTVEKNAIEDHIPPVIPDYLTYGIGRGATSSIALNMQNNWWGSELGPYEPDQHADGRGDAPGVNIAFAPWLTSRPACAPTRP